MDLQNTFYVMGIVLMCLIFIVLIAGVVAIFAIKAKINAIHKTIEDKLSLVTTAAGAGAQLFKKAKEVVDRHN
jgi:uncharacterized membrane protein YraQ (UPF0718 family)